MARATDSSASTSIPAPSPSERPSRSLEYGAAGFVDSDWRLVNPANAVSVKASLPPTSIASTRPAPIASVACAMACAPEAQAVLTETEGPRSPKALLSASAMACGETSR